MAKAATKPVAPKATGKVLPDQTQGQESTPPAAKAPKAKRSRNELYANLKSVLPTHVITLVGGAKAKVAKTMAEAKFALYGEGNISVADVRAKCQGEKRATFVNKNGVSVALKPSIAWDWAHGLIQIDGRAYDPKTGTFAS